MYEHVSQYWIRRLEQIASVNDCISQALLREVAVLTREDNIGTKIGQVHPDPVEGSKNVFSIPAPDLQWDRGELLAVTGLTERNAPEIMKDCPRCPDGDNKNTVSVIRGVYFCLECNLRF